MSHATVSRCGLPTTRDLTWAVVKQNLAGACYLVPIRFSSRDDGERAFNRIKARLNAVNPSFWANRLLIAMVTKQVAHKATIKYVSTVAMHPRCEGMLIT